MKGSCSNHHQVHCTARQPYLFCSDWRSMKAHHQKDALDVCRQYGCNICGEGGEYETLVLDCPLFKHARIVLDSWETDHLSSGDVAILRPLTFHTEPKGAASDPSCSLRPEVYEAAVAGESSAVHHVSAAPNASAPSWDGAEIGAKHVTAQRFEKAARPSETASWSTAGAEANDISTMAEVHTVPCQPAHDDSSSSTALQQHLQAASTASQPKLPDLAVDIKTEACFSRSSQALSVFCTARATGDSAHASAAALTEAAVDAALAAASRGQLTFRRL